MSDHQGNEFNTPPLATGPEVAGNVEDRMPGTGETSTTGAGSALLTLRQMISRPWPSVLELSDAAIQRRAGVVGAVLGTLVAVAIYVLAPADSVLRDTLDPKRYESLIPLAILWMFFWGLAICHYRRRQYNALLETSPPELLATINLALKSVGRLEPLDEVLDDESCEKSPLLRRVQAVTRQWLVEPNLQDADVMLQHHNTRDVEALQRSYSMVRVFVWALPVLGLIGTVLGIADAVGGFARFLGGNITEVAAIREKLVEVTGGLSFAFLITLQGLLTSLITMLLASNLQSREEKFYSRVEQGVAEEFLPVVQRIAPPADSSPEVADLTAWRTMLEKIATGTVEAVERVANETIVNLREAGEKNVARVDEAAREMLSRFAGGFSDVADALRGVTASVDRTGAEASERLALQVSAFGGAMRSLEDARLGEGLASIAEAISTQREALQRTTTVIDQVVAETERVLEVQMAMEQSIRNMQDGDLGKSLRMLGSSLEQLNPVLRGFQQPFVFQAVPLEPSS